MGLPDPDEECHRTGLTVRGCHHCREVGNYTPQNLGDMGLSIADLERAPGHLSIDPDGSVWVSPGKLDLEGVDWLSPDEAFHRGNFGKGEHWRFER